MLVLTRKKNEAILIKAIEGDIRVVIIDGDKGKVRIGIEAPKGYIILREELLTEIKNSNMLSAIKDAREAEELVRKSHA